MRTVVFFLLLAAVPSAAVAESNVTPGNRSIRPLYSSSMVRWCTSTGRTAYAPLKDRPEGFFLCEQGEPPLPQPGTKATREQVQEAWKAREQAMHERQRGANEYYAKKAEKSEREYKERMKKINETSPYRPYFDAAGRPIEKRGVRGFNDDRPYYQRYGIYPRKRGL